MVCLQDCVVLVAQSPQPYNLEPAKSFDLRTGMDAASCGMPCLSSSFSVQCVPLARQRKELALVFFSTF